MNIEKGSWVRLRCRIRDDATGEDLHPFLDLPAETSITYLHGLEPAPIPGLSQAVTGLAEGFTGNVTIPPTLAYGEYRPELVFEAVRENLPDVALEPGMPLYTQGPTGVFSLRVVRLTDKGAVLDGNHPLAGRTLRVNLEIQCVRPATAEEIAGSGRQR
jgi:FKBP-type peptidyl-prolyl cis-trans isomerase SlyD